MIDRFKIRQQNESIIIAKILEFSKISRSQLSNLTGLNKATVSDIIQKLINEEILIETGSGTGSELGGKKPILLEINKNIGYIISIELGKDYVSYCLSNLIGNFINIEREKITHPTNKNYVEKIDFIYKKYKHIFENSKYKLIGIAVAIHGIVVENKIEFTPKYEIDQINLYKILEEKYNVPIFIENEANLVALSDSTFIKNQKNIVSLSIHNGIGAGIIVNNKLVKGKNGSAGEIGHSILILNGLSCKCGNKGCLELYCSHEKLLKNYEIKTNKKINLDTLCKKYAENDETAVEIINENCFLLSQVINNILVVTCPEVLFIDSFLINKIPNLIDLVLKNISNSWLQNIEIKISNIEKFGAIYGGVSLVIRHFFKIKNCIYINKEEE